MSAFVSGDEYHRMIESGAFGEHDNVELIDGEIVALGPKTPAHEDVLARLTERLFMSGLDLEQLQIRVRGQLSLGNSEPEPDLSVIERDVARPYHPATAALVIEVAVSSQRRDLRVKPRLYAGAGVPVYWVIDVDGGRAVQHTYPVDGEYQRVEVVAELTAPHIGLPPVVVADVLASAR